MKKTNEILKYEYEENPRSEFPVVSDPNLNFFFLRRTETKNKQKDSINLRLELCSDTN